MEVKSNNNKKSAFDTHENFVILLTRSYIEIEKLQKKESK